MSRLRDFSLQDLDPKALGTVAIALLGAVLVAVFAVGELGLLEDRYEASAVFEDGGGLREGGAVRVAGVPVGEVTDITPDFTRGQVVVTFAVDREVDLGPQPTARIAPNTVLGGFHLRIAGPVEEPYLADLEPGERRIPLERTTLSFTVVDTLESATEAIDELDVATIDAVIDALADVIERDQDEYFALLERIRDLATLVSDREDEITELLTQGQAVTATLRARDEEVLDLARVATRVLDRLEERRDELQVLLGDGSGAVDRFTDVLVDNREVLQALLDDLEPVLDLTERREDELRRSLVTFPTAFEELADAGNDGDWLDIVAEGFAPLDLGAR